MTETLPAAETAQTVLVEFQIRTETTTMAAWLEEWDKRGQDAYHGEPDTTAYAAAINVDAPDSVLVFERYARGAESLRAHVERPAHKALHATMGERNMTRRRVFSSLCEDIPNLGWWARPGTDSATAAGNIIVLLGMRFPEPEQLAHFLALIEGHAGYCWDNEPETLAYAGALATRDADRGIDQRAGDLVWVMTCRDMDAVNRHAEDPVHVALGAQAEAAGIAAEQTFMRTYRTTGCGYLWR